MDALLESLGCDQSLDDTSAIIKDETACIRCGLCAQRCPVGAITMERMSFSTQWSEVGATC